jgi:hypothetical protein
MNDPSPHPPPQTTSLAGLPKSATPNDLLTAATGAARGKRSGLKAGAAPKVGVRKTLHATHADGMPLALEMQVGGRSVFWAGGRSLEGG